MDDWKKMPYWVDQVFEKHECGPYARSRAVELECQGQRILLLFPWYLPGVRVVHSAVAGDLLFVLGKTLALPETDDEAYDPTREFDASDPAPDPPAPPESPEDESRDALLMVARHRSDNVWWCVVWHEMYPWALKHLGLERGPAHEDASTPYTQ